MAIKRNKYFMTDLLENIKQYMQSYNCSLISAIQDQDFPITYNEVRELAKLTNTQVTEEDIKKAGASDKAVVSFERAEQADYDSIYG